MNQAKKAMPILFIGIAAILGGCATVQLLQSKPPYSSITVHEPIIWGDAVLTKKFQYPVGKYLPKFEDENGYYYAAPDKVVTRDTFFSSLNEGGLFLGKGEASPTHVYILSNQGVPNRVGIGDRAKLTLNR
jgi:hypothetical protein